MIGVCAVVLAAALLLADATRALSPPARAAIVFSNAGRIVEVNADGSARSVLTRPGQVRTPGQNGRIGDRFPRVSPDGSRILFLRDLAVLAPENEYLMDGRNMLLDRRSGKVREVLPGTERVDYQRPAWIPGTGRVLASKSVIGDVMRRSVVSIGLDGRGERTILTFKPYRGGMPKKNLEALEFAVSPDGGSALMTVMDYWSIAGYQLELVDLATGKRRLVARNAHSASWSPDGSRFVFVRDRAGHEVCDWDFDCVPSGDLFTAGGDGTGIKRLTDSRRDEASPTWSPDGEQIVFSGTIGHPGDRSSSELLAMDPEGGCANWLTNGSPASFDPEFVPRSGVAARLGCEPVARQPLAENRLNPVEKKGFGKRLWLGPESSQGMLSVDADIVFLSFAIYTDCPHFRVSECGPGATVGTSPVCFDQGNWAEIAARLARTSHKTKRRGVWIVQDRRRGRLETTVYSGRRTTTISGAIRPHDTTTGKLGRKAQLALVEELRVEGQKRRARLPRLAIPRFDFGLARRVTAEVRRSSIGRVAKKYEAKRRWVVHQLSFRRNIGRLGPVDRVRCPDTRDPWGIDS